MTHSHRRRFTPTLLRRASMACAAALAVVLAAAGPAPAQPSGWSSSFNNLTAQTRSDWMGQVPDATSLGSMSIPGTHDTLAIHGGSLLPDSYEAQEDHGDSAATLTAQLDAGIRSIDIRVRVTGGAFAIHHTTIYQNANFDDVLTKAQAFLSAHPTETVLMDLHGECDADSTEGGSGTASIGHCADDPSNTTAAQRISIFEGYVARYPGLFYAPSVTGNSTADLPTLGQARGHIVLTDFTGPRGEVYAGFGLTQLTTGNWGSYVENDYTQCDTTSKWNEVQANLVAANNDGSGALYTTYTSSNCAPFGSNPAQVAANENPLLLNYLNAGNAARTGVVKMDYPGYALVTAIVNRNPGVTFSGALASGISGKCLDAAYDGSSNGTVVDLYTCNGTAAQTWTPQSDGTLRINGLCLDVIGGGTGNGTKVDLWSCTGGSNQQWTATESGALVSAQSGLCLDDPGATSTDMTQLDIWSCHSTNGQVWTLP